MYTGKEDEFLRHFGISIEMKNTIEQFVNSLAGTQGLHSMAEDLDLIKEEFLNTNELKYALFFYGYWIGYVKAKSTFTEMVDFFDKGPIQ